LFTADHISSNTRICSGENTGLNVVVFVGWAVWVGVGVSVGVTEGIILVLVKVGEIGVDVFFSGRT